MLLLTDRIVEPPEPSSGRDILVVDDSRTSLHVIGKRLHRRGYRVTLAEGGPQAIALMQGRAFDLILLDMIMPGMSGIRTLGQIRAMRYGGDTPVMMMTTRHDIGATVEALDAGADDHIAKPFDFDVLVARIARLLDRARAFAELRLVNAALDIRVATKNAENAELKDRLAVTSAEASRLAASVEALEAQLVFSAAASAVG